MRLLKRLVILKKIIMDVKCHALVLTRKDITVNSDGNKMVDIISKLEL